VHVTARWLHLTAAVCLSAAVVVPSSASSAMAATQPPGWNIELTGNFPDAADETVTFNVVATVATDAAAAVTYDFRLRLPDGEEADLGRASPSFSTYMRGGSVGDVMEWRHADPGPYTGRVVWIDHGRETVVAELSGWVGAADAPVVVLEHLEADPPTPRVGEPATVSVTVTNTGQTPGSRTVPLWMWVDDLSYQQVGGVTFTDVGPGETVTRGYTWTPRFAVSSTRLGASTSAADHGLVLAPFTVLAAEDSAAAPEN
jgi:hypothetical protein